MKTDVARHKELGRELARVRDRAGLTQAQLAARLGVSQAVVSRSESGERRLGSAELQRFAEAIGIEEARGLETRRSRRWKAMKRPPLGHPDHDLLWKAELALRELETLQEQPDIAQAFAQRIRVFSKEIGTAVEKLLRRTCSVVFIGKIGVGKTSAICYIADLVVIGSGSLRRPSPVLDVGAGRITLCEVHVRTGPTRIVIDPCTDKEIHAHVADFADKVLGATRGDGGEGAAQGGQIISWEVERVIRNMAGLLRRIHGDQPLDPARELAQQILTEEQGRGKSDRDVALRLQNEVLTRMRLRSRQRRELWWNEGAGVDPLQWLKSEFHLINNGRNPEFTIPKRVYVSLDRSLIADTADVEVRIVDTKGIDETVARADLEHHVGASHTVLVLCSGFNEAPGREATDLLQRASEAGIEDGRLQGVLLGLAKYDQALKVPNDAGDPVESIEEGYLLKTISVKADVHGRRGFKGFSVQFFNSHEDDPAGIRRELSNRIGLLFDGYRDAVEALVRSAAEVVENYEDEQVQELVRQVTVPIRSWLDRNMDVSSIEQEVQHSLLGEVKGAHPATIHATMRRKGGWYNLDYGYHLARGAGLVVRFVLQDRMKRFGDLCDAYLGCEEYHPAHALLRQVRRAIERASHNLAERAHLDGETWFRNNLEVNEEFWLDGMARWGRGAGYRRHIVDMTKQWFSENGQINEEIFALIKREWKRAMHDVTGMLEGD